ncbi:hypothetical protein [Candidatus Chlorohelix sp.]|uniref:hypothetical protein n=1 Tax=Candidatus Chlorohelix sp. TaxID=3139201 RepID=UPI003026E0AE
MKIQRSHRLVAPGIFVVLSLLLSLMVAAFSPLTKANFSETPVVKQASMICNMAVVPDRSLKPAQETVVGASFKITNEGNGRSFDQHIEMPFDATLVTGYTTFSDPGMWVNSVEAGLLRINLPALEPGNSLSGTVFFRPNPDNMPAVGKELSFFYYLKYTTGEDLPVFTADSIYNFSSALGYFRTQGITNGTCTSNTVKVSFASDNRNETDGKVMPLTPSETAVNAGTLVTLTGDMFIAGDLLSTWITNPNGQSTALANGRANDKGVGSLTVDTTGLAAGSYVIAIYGQHTEITGRTILTIK